MATRPSKSVIGTIRGRFTCGSLRTFAILGFACVVLPGSARGQYGISAWGSNSANQCKSRRPQTPQLRNRGGLRAHGRAPERRLRRRVGGQRLRPVQRAGASGRAHLRRGRGGLVDHTVARRSDGSVVAWGYNAYGQCNVPALPAGLTYVEVAAGDRSHGGAAERRLRRRVGGQQLRPVQRSGASGRAHLRRGRGGRLVTRWRAGATARSSRGGTTAYGQCNVPALPAGLTYVEVAAGYRSHGGAPERRLRRRVGRQRLRPVQRAGASGRAHLRRGRGGRRVTRWRAGATAPSSRGETTTTASATCRRSRPGSPTSRSRRAADHTVARRSDGSVVAWGDNYYGQCNVPALPAGLTYVEVAAGD